MMVDKIAFLSLIILWPSGVGAPRGQRPGNLNLDLNNNRWNRCAGEQWSVYLSILFSFARRSRGI